MIFRQLLDSLTSTYTYLLADESTKEALLIDTVFEHHQRDLALLRELGLKLCYTLETHVHADHVTGAWLMKEATGSKIAVAKKGHTQGADLEFAGGDTIEVGAVQLEVRATPGHTDGCVSFIDRGGKRVFSGDALLIRGAGRTDFQEGSPNTLFQSVHTQLFSLPDEYSVYPGHDYSGRTMTTVAEEKAYNPRLGTKVREEDFVVYMNNLGLPHPKKLDIALPANLRCGKPESADGVPPVATWGPVVRTYAGVYQIEPEWVQQHRSEVLLLDVCEQAEREASDLFSLAGAVAVPLSELREKAKALPQDRPIITTCPSGARSAMAAMILEKAGVPQVANLRGGLIEWKLLGLPMG